MSKSVKYLQKNTIKEVTSHPFNNFNTPASDFCTVLYTSDFLKCHTAFNFWQYLTLKRDMALDDPLSDGGHAQFIQSFLK